MVIDRDEKDKQDQREKKELNFKKQRELLRFQMQQIGEVLPENNDDKAISMISSKKKNINGKKALVGGPMNMEEIRMNRELL